MKADRLRAEHPIEDRGEEVLTGVLLHVIKSARPVDLSLDRLADLEHPIGLRSDHMDDPAVVLVNDIDDRPAAERAGVERLSA